MISTNPWISILKSYTNISDHLLDAFTDDINGSGDNQEENHWNILFKATVSEITDL